MAIPAPKYMMIKNHLLKGVSSGLFEHLYPSENELAQQFSVSRMTARKALSELVRDGYAERIPGKGTYVKEQKFAQGFFRVRPFKTYAKEMNVTPGTKVLQIETMEPPEEISLKLETDKTIFVKRIHFFDSKPVRLETRYLTYDLCRDILHEDLATESINEILVVKNKLPITKVWQRLNVTLLKNDEASLLEAETGSPAFHMKRLTYTFDKPVTFVEYFMRGDSFSFEDIFQPQQNELD